VPSHLFVIYLEIEKFSHFVKEEGDRDKKRNKFNCTYCIFHLKKEKNAN